MSSSKSMPRSFKDLVRLFSKRFNKSTIADIENGLGPYSIICHTGRKSGRAFRTPVDATFLGDVVIITLPYGMLSDWLRNVLAQKGCQIIHKGQTYSARDPEVLTAAAVRGLLPPGKTGLFQVKEFLRMSISILPVTEKS
jgi:deazaflavin-dependent oxidoreductase (nitroreductase family)